MNVLAGPVGADLLTEPQFGSWDLSSMPAPPSFSSFPPSFTSFPDLGSSSRQDLGTEPSVTASVQQRDSKDKDKESDRKKKKRDRRDKQSRLGRIPSRERGDGIRDSQSNVRAFDDERLKAEEDSARRTRQRDVSQPVFFSDKKGDPLSMQYGGIHAGDVPKYHLFGCELHLS